MKIEEMKNKEEWESFLSDCQEKTFLQAWNWSEFNKNMGKTIWRLGVYDGDNLVAVCLVIKIKAKRGIYLLVEHGPIVKSKVQSPKSKVLKELLDYLKKIGEEEQASFVRICPIWEETEENKKIFRDLGFREAPMHEHPELSWALDLDKSEDEILMGMRKTTRYLIRQAIKNPEIEIQKNSQLKDVDIFNQVYQRTVERHNFVPFPLEYLKNEFLAFNSDNQILIFLGQYKNEIVASAMIIYWQDTAFYHQGASLHKYDKIPVSYLLQWEAIKEAKNRGLKHYSFWGIADGSPKSKVPRPSAGAASGVGQSPKLRLKEHPWAGLTLFKTGFGGREERYVKTQDFVLSKKYWLNYFIENIRKIKRGFR